MKGEFAVKPSEFFVGWLFSWFSTISGRLWGPSAGLSPKDGVFRRPGEYIEESIEITKPEG